MYIILGILIPFIGTLFGSLTVLFLKKNINRKIENILYGFSSGVMIAASIWSLIIPAIEQGKRPFNIIPVIFGVIAGIFLFIIIEKLNVKSKSMLSLAVTLHNIPEGMAVGVMFASVLFKNENIGIMAALVLSIGIAIQNIPEGAIISLPLMITGSSKKKSIFYGALSGVVEPISAVVTIILVNLVTPILPFLLSFAAGAMIFVVVQELIPKMNDEGNTNLPIIGFTVGFLLMMTLDVLLG